MYTEDVSIDYDIFDLLLTPVYIAIVLLIANIYKHKKIQDKPEYKYFTMGLAAKIFGAISLGLIYYFYYKGGDTTFYYKSAKAYVNLFFKNQTDFFLCWLGDPEGDDYNYFDETTGFSMYHHHDKHAFFVVRLLVPLVALGAKSYFASAVIVGAVTFTGVWKLYQVFLEEFPHLKKELAIACLFIPSCIFWGSGLMKDSFTLSAVGWYTYGFYFLLIKKRFRPKYFFHLAISTFIILAIKPYIFFALFPGSILWLTNNFIKRVGNKTLRALANPILIAMGLAVGYFAVKQLGDNLGEYKMDKVLDRAVVIQQDMKAEYYQGKTFDIGDFDPSVSGVLSKAHVAIFAGVFRPGIWDVRNVVMGVSALENTYLLLLTLFLLLRLKFLGFFGYIGKSPLVLFSLMFSIFFAFSVGLTVANFGSLVRLRIPELPFFVASLFIIRDFYETKKKKDKEPKIQARAQSFIA